MRERERERLWLKTLIHLLFLNIVFLSSFPCSYFYLRFRLYIMLMQGSDWDFGIFSGLEGVEKPNPKIYEIALERAGNVAPEEVLHIGDSMRKDYIPARSVGMHALLLDRFKTSDAEEWRKSGATVLPDLVAVQEWLTKN